MKKGCLFFLVTLLILLAVSAALVCAVLGGIPAVHKGLRFAEQYRADKEGDLVRFTQEDFGETESLDFQVKDVCGMFRSTGAVYTARYSAEQYEKQKTALGSLPCLTEADALDGNGNLLLPAVTAGKNGWIVRVLTPQGDESLPKRFRMIAADDGTQAIAYLCFTDPDLDYVSEEPGEQALIRFIEKSFGFRFD